MFRTGSSSLVASDSWNSSRQVILTFKFLKTKITALFYLLFLIDTTSKENVLVALQPIHIFYVALSHSPDSDFMTQIVIYSEIEITSLDYSYCTSTYTRYGPTSGESQVI